MLVSLFSFPSAHPQVFPYFLQVRSSRISPASRFRHFMSRLARFSPPASTFGAFLSRRGVYVLQAFISLNRFAQCIIGSRRHQMPYGSHVFARQIREGREQSLRGARHKYLQGMYQKAHDANMLSFLACTSFFHIDIVRVSQLAKRFVTRPLAEGTSARHWRALPLFRCRG